MRKVGALPLPVPGVEAAQHRGREESYPLLVAGLYEKILSSSGTTVLGSGLLPGRQFLQMWSSPHPVLGPQGKGRDTGFPCSL